MRMTFSFRVSFGFYKLDVENSGERIFISHSRRKNESCPSTGMHFKDTLCKSFHHLVGHHTERIRILSLDQPVGIENISVQIPARVMHSNLHTGLDRVLGSLACFPPNNGLWRHSAFPIPHSALFT